MTVKGKKGVFRRFFGTSWKGIKRHKIFGIAIVLLILLVCAFLLVPRLARGNASRASMESYSFIRTVTLSKGDLSEVVSTTGIVDSALTSTVSYASNGSAPKVKTVNFAVGDAVKEGDVIVTLDTESIQKSIDDELESLAKEQETQMDRIADAKETYNEAVESCEEAEENLAEGQTEYQEAQDEYNSTSVAYEAAESQISYYQDAYDDATDAEAAAGLVYNDAKASYDYYAQYWEAAEADAAEAKADLEEATADYNKAMTVDVVSAQRAYDTALNQYMVAEDAYFNRADDADYNAVYQQYRYAKTALETAESELENAQELVNNIQSLEWDIQNAKNRLANVEVALNEMEYNRTRMEERYNTAKEDYETAQNKTRQAQEALNNAKSLCDYDVCKSEFETAEREYETAESNLEQLENKVKSAQKTKKQALENYEDACDTEVTSSKLEDLYEQLENCSLKAETDGKITSLNVNVGDTPNGVIATIEDTDTLIISITIPEADINSVELGMECAISSDATDEEIFGKLTQIDPTSTQTGSFGAEVLVTTKGTALKIGVNASVDIITSRTEDCFTVPIDAVGNEDDGMGDYVYRSIGGSGTEITFEKVYVTTGETNDYYVEISSGDLQEGDIIRASADLTQGLETVGGEEETEASGGITDLFGGMTGGGMAGGGMAGGGNAGGGMPGGGMPSGGNAGGMGPR